MAFYAFTDTRPDGEKLPLIAGDLGDAAVGRQLPHRGFVQSGFKLLPHRAGGDICAAEQFEPSVILVDAGGRQPYKRFRGCKGTVNRIMIRTATDGLVDLGERSSVVSAIEPFRFCAFTCGR